MSKHKLRLSLGRQHFKELLEALINRSKSPEEFENWLERMKRHVTVARDEEITLKDKFRVLLEYKAALQTLTETDLKTRQPEIQHLREQIDALRNAPTELDLLKRMSNLAKDNPAMKAFFKELCSTTAKNE